MLHPLLSLHRLEALIMSLNGRLNMALQREREVAKTQQSSLLNSRIIVFIQVVMGVHKIRLGSGLVDIIMHHVCHVSKGK